MKKRIVSIVVPTKNSAATLDECLTSIDKQTYDKNCIELIVIDNFSIDETKQIALKHTRNFKEIGPERSAQRNYGVDIAKGEFVCIIDSDMTLDPNVIEQCVERFTSSSEIAGIIIPEESFGEGFWAQCKKLERSFYVGVSYMEAARFFKKIDFQSVGGYDVTMVSGEDWDLSQRIEVKGKFSRTKSYIYHNEGKISLVKTIQKKYYYAQLFAAYTVKSSNLQNASNQTSIVGRYALFLSQPGRLFKNPLLGIGMLFMKTCEFGFGGLGYLLAKRKLS